MSRAANRHLRRALYMPALAAVRCDPHLKAFYEVLLSRHKAKLQAIIAVARKLPHAIYGIFRSQTPYDGSKLFPAHACHHHLQIKREISPLDTPKEKTMLADEERI